MSIKYQVFKMIIFFTLGTDTTATGLTCLLLILVHKPDVQLKLHQEIDSVIGLDRPPCLSDRANMPFLQAVLLELLRYISHVPLAVPHYTMRDTSVQDIAIKANSTVSTSSLFYSP